MTPIYSGLAIGSIYVLVAVGYNLVYLASGLINFAQAHFVMFATYIAYVTLVSRGMPAAEAVLVGVVLCGALALAEERLAVRPLLRDFVGTGGNTHNVLITTLGTAVVIEGIAYVLWGPDPHRVPFFGGDRVLTIAGGRILDVELILVAAGIALPLIIDFISRNTAFGLALLATAEDAESARLHGIKVRRMVMGAFIAAGSIAGAMGAFVAPITLATPEIGHFLAVKAFVALALGGFGNQTGAMIGGFAIGLTESLTARYLGPEYTDLLVFVLLLLVLLARPAGIFGRSRERRI